MFLNQGNVSSKHSNDNICEFFIGSYHIKFEEEEGFGKSNTGQEDDTT
jgi:hypothetical protein